MTQNFENYTAEFIIFRAIAEKAEAFRAALIKQAEEHDDYSQLTRNEGARRGAISQKNACLAAYDVIGNREKSPNERAQMLTLAEKIGPAIVALNVACKLLDIPAHVRTQAAIGLDRD